MRYKPNLVWVIGIILCLIIPLILILPTVLSNPTLVDNKTSLLGLVVLIIIAMYPLGRSAKLEGSKFCHIDFFVWRKCLWIPNIETISYPPTYGIGKSNRRLTIREKSEGPFEYREIFMPNPAFHRKMLAQIVRDLLKVNQNIEIDSDVEDLLKNY